MRPLLTLFALFLAMAPAASAAEAGPHWVGTWATAPQLAEPHNRPPAPGLAGATLRQILRVSIGGKKIRLRLSNAFGNAAVILSSVHLARSAGGSTIEPASDRALHFSGAESVAIPPGAPVVSDELDFDLAPLSALAITMHVERVPNDLTAHPGSRTTSYLISGDFVSAAELPTATAIEHWYLVNGIDVLAEHAAAIVVLGDSITDGRGSTTNGNDRWPDLLARRLQTNPGTAGIAVLNEGIGGNRILRDGLGPNALARFDRDVLAQNGVRWLIVLEGVNDIGTAVAARAAGEPGATAQDVIAAYEQMIARAHERDIRVLGATILPFEGFKMYAGPESEADRQTINRWIRTSGKFDAVVDFDAALRDPADESRLATDIDGGDRLHPNPAGYRKMADTVDLHFFTN